MCPGETETASLCLLVNRLHQASQLPTESMALGVSILTCELLASQDGVGTHNQVLVSLNEGACSSLVYHAIFLEELTTLELIEKIASLYSIPPQHIHRVYRQGPTGIHVVVSNEVS